MNSDLVWQLVRYVLLAIGGSLVSRGLITQSVLQTDVSAVVTLMIGGWGIYVKWRTRAVVVEAIGPQTIVKHPMTGQLTTIGGK